MSTRKRKKEGFSAGPQLKRMIDKQKEIEGRTTNMAQIDSFYEEWKKEAGGILLLVARRQERD